MKIAIIGAGLAGLTLARKLAPAHEVTVFEKARGPGGRMSTRRAASFAFDHGAQYFTAATDEFRAFLAPLMSQGLVEPWPAAITLRAGAKVSDKPKYTAAPGMNAICKSLAEGLDLRLDCRIESLRRGSEGWRLLAVSGDVFGGYDWVVSSAPAPQTAALFPGAFEGMAALSRVKMLGCFALMLGFETPLAIDWHALKSGTPPIGWIAVNSAKPGRGSAVSLLVQSSNDWADEHLATDPEQVAGILIKAASELAGRDLSSASHQALHRWLYAATQTPVGRSFLKDDALQLAACGDWCLGGKVEAAFLSASALAESFGS